MNAHEHLEFTGLDAFGAVMIAAVYIILNSLIKEPHRQNFNALMISGAGAAYLSNGLGIWEFVFCAAMTLVAFQGLKNYAFIGLGWLMHTGWDILHHFYGEPIVPFVPTSSAGCALADSLFAIWFFMGAPSIFEWIKRNKSQSQNTPTHV